MNEIKRREILFLYDVTFANPNGDPNDENKPRIDEETMINYVTDVRLKRTIRDYLKDYKNKEIFIFEESGEKGERISKKERIKKYGNDPRKALEECIDLRLFGSTFAIENKDKGKNKVETSETTESQENNLSITGPVQFKFGKSLHRVKSEFVKGTTVMPGGEGKQAGTFTEKYVLPYSLICFSGLVNGKVAEIEGINLTLDDINLMYEGMWEGTKTLFTTSKAQQPRLLLEVVYKDETFHIGDLEKGLKLITKVEEEALRSPEDYSVDITNLVSLLEKYKDHIDFIRVKEGDLIKFNYNGEQTSLSKVLIDKGFEVKEFGF
ncbi:MAG: type I-B CRISPR-associated protein Cas7/Csh2 [Caldisericum sp.]|uniref:type I-B CRISPR-associated protein Cas7/Csh2 n=1 Tax=Caldisericum sp. TaxID=2499687 RepID=UPI003D0EEFF6